MICVAGIAAAVGIMQGGSKVAPKKQNAFKKSCTEYALSVVLSWLPCG